MITEMIEINGFVWNVQEDKDGINLYDADGAFVCKFTDHKEMLHFVKGATVCGKVRG